MVDEVGEVRGGGEEGVAGQGAEELVGGDAGAFQGVVGVFESLVLGPERGDYVFELDNSGGEGFSLNLLVFV